MSVTSPLMSLSGLYAWPTTHLSEAATCWTHIAESWENAFTQISKHMSTPGGTPWIGEAAEKAQSRADGDNMKVSGVAYQLRETAEIARLGRDQLEALKQQAIVAVDDARADGFRVGEDLSVTDTRTGGSREERAARKVQAEGHTAYIRHRAAALVARDDEIGSRISAASQGINKVSFDEAKPFEVTPLATYRPPPDVVLTWCEPFMSSFLCTDYYPDGSRHDYRHHLDRSGVWP